MQVWLIYLGVNLQHIEFDNVFRVESGTSKVLVSYLDLTNQLANTKLKFRGFKIKTTVCVMY